MSTDATTDCRHSPCFSSVLWYGTAHSFTESQAGIVAILWQNWQQGTPDVREVYLLNAVGSSSATVANLFRRSSAWGTMIQAGETRLTRRLVALK